MKLTISSILFVLTAGLMVQCKKEGPQVKITDNNLLNTLIERGVDANHDGIIISAEAEAVTYLNIGRYNISDMSGIEAFINLDTLICVGKKLVTLDVSGNPAGSGGNSLCPTGLVDDMTTTR